MTIPKYQTIMLPLLKYARDGQDHQIREAIIFLADEFELTEEEQRELLPSGKQAIFDNRVGWARTYLKKACLLHSKKRGYFAITERGLDALTKKLDKIDLDFLKQYPEFIDFKNKKSTDDATIKDTEELNPEEIIENGYQKLHDSLVFELLKTVKEFSPTFFEVLVVDVLTKMGYGGSRKDAGEAIGKSGDGGIDGIIKEDRLGLDVIYIQAKRWGDTVGRPEIQKFAGALIGKKAKKGVFITTSDFSKGAIEYADFTGNIVLINGEKLANLMIEYDVGVSKITSYDIKKIDYDYFADD
jgi:restriction system protein